MDAVKVNRMQLISILETNRDKHRSTFLEAQEGFRKQVINQLDRHLRDAREGRKIVLHVVLPQPVDQTADYERVIGMLKMSVDETVSLCEDNYSQYVLDNWRWKSQWNETVMNYR